MSASQKDRIPYFDNLRFFLILLVVVGHFADELTSRSHTAQSVYLWIYSFHMPLFIFLSGLFHKNQRIMPKVLRLLMIGYVLKIFRLLADLAMGNKPSLSYSVWSDVSWYVLVLAGYIALSYLLRRMDQRFILAFALVLGLFSGYDSKIGNKFAASRFIVFYSFYVLGEILSPDALLKIMRKKWVRVLGVTVLILWGGLCLFRLEAVYPLRFLFRGKFTLRKRYGSWAFLYRGLSYLIELIAGCGAMCLIPERKIPVITRLGGRTLQIYFWHYIIKDILQALPVYAFLSESSAGKAAWLLLGVVCTFTLGLKLFGFPTNQIIKACRYARDPIEEEKA